MSIRFISEVLDEVSKADSEEKKIALLRKYDTIPLKKILYAALVTKVKFLIEGEVKYKPTDVPHGLADTSLYQEVKKLYLFVEGGSPIAAAKRLEIYTVLLETIQKDEAEVLECTRLKTLSARYNLSRSVVEKAFPGLLPDEPTTEPVKAGRPIGTPNSLEAKKKHRQKKQKKREQEVTVEPKVESDNGPTE